MENLEDDSHVGLKEKPPLVIEQLKIKFNMKIIRAAALNKGKEVDHSSKDLENGAMVCKKSFPSGDTRCHSESRRITTSLESSLMPLPAGCKRRRTDAVGGGTAFLRTKSSIKDGVDEEELVKGAVYGLMFLATGDDRYRKVPSKDDDEIRVWDDNYNLFMSKEVVALSNKKRKICGYDDEDVRKTDEDCKHKLEMAVYEHMDVGNGISSIRCKRKRTDTTNQQTTKSYTCSVCDKSFLTPQALGGHTSSAHGKKILVRDDRKAQKQVMVVKDGVVFDEYYTKDAEDLCGFRIGRERGEMHKCKTCGKEFPSGQALGGHKRLHWQAPQVQAGHDELALALSFPTFRPKVEEEDQAQAQAQGGEEQVARKVWLDLNEIPADDE